MNYFDIILIIPIIWGAYKGFSKGLIIEVAALVALCLGIYGGLNFSGFAARLLTDLFSFESDYLPLISFAITFIGIVVAVYLVAKAIEKVVNIASLKMINKLTGALFGLIKVGLILSIVLLIFDSFDRKIGIISPAVKDNSLLYQPVKSLAPSVIPTLRDMDWLMELTTSD